MKQEKQRNWAELPSELLALIMILLGPYEILENVQRVCRSWRQVSKEPSLWRKVNIDNLTYGMCRQAIDRSQGGLVEVNIGYSGSDELINYIAYRSSSRLRRLVLESLYGMTCEGLVNALAKLPSLEEIDFKSSPLLRLDLRATKMFESFLNVPVVVS